MSNARGARESRVPDKYVQGMASVAYLMGPVWPLNCADQVGSHIVAGLCTLSCEHRWPNNGTRPETGTLVIRVRAEAVRREKLASKALIQDGSQHDC